MLLHGAFLALDSLHVYPVVTWIPLNCSREMHRSVQQLKGLIFPGKEGEQAGEGSVAENCPSVLQGCCHPAVCAPPGITLLFSQLDPSFTDFGKGFVVAIK